MKKKKEKTPSVMKELMEIIAQAERSMNMAEDVARLVLFTAETRVNMYNMEAFHLEEEVCKRAGNLWGPDPAEFYYMTLEQAAEHACRFLGFDIRLARFIELSLYWWNDTIWWAEDIFGMHEEEKARWEKERELFNYLKEESTDGH